MAWTPALLDRPWHERPADDGGDGGARFTQRSGLDLAELGAARLRSTSTGSATRWRRVTATWRSASTATCCPSMRTGHCPRDPIRACRTWPPCGLAGLHAPAHGDIGDHGAVPVATGPLGGDRLERRHPVPRPRPGDGQPATLLLEGLTRPSPPASQPKPPGSSTRTPSHRAQDLPQPAHPPGARPIMKMRRWAASSPRRESSRRAELTMQSAAERIPSTEGDDAAGADPVQLGEGSSASG